MKLITTLITGVAASRSGVTPDFVTPGHIITVGSPIKSRCQTFEVRAFESAPMDSEVFIDIQPWTRKLVSGMEIRFLQELHHRDELCIAWIHWTHIFKDAVNPKRSRSQPELARELLVALSTLAGVTYDDPMASSDDGSTDDESSVSTGTAAEHARVRGIAQQFALHSPIEIGMDFGQAAEMWYSAYMRGARNQFLNAIDGYLKSLRMYRRRHSLSSRLLFPPSLMVRSLGATLSHPDNDPVHGFRQNDPFVLPLEPYAQEMITFLARLISEKAPPSLGTPKWIWKEGVRPYTLLLKNFVSLKYMSEAWTGPVTRYRDLIGQLYVLASLGVFKGEDDKDFIVALVGRMMADEADSDDKYNELVRSINSRLKLNNYEN